jgi:hypothetical protein
MFNKINGGKNTEKTPIGILTAMLANNSYFRYTKLKGGTHCKTAVLQIS